MAKKTEKDCAMAKKGINKTTGPWPKYEYNKKTRSWSRRKIATQKNNRGQKKNDNKTVPGLKHC